MRISKKSQTKVNIIAIKVLAVALSEKPRTQPELIEITGLANSTISRYIGILHSKPNLVYVADWKRKGERGNYSALWAWGYKEFDMPKPKALSSAEYNKRWRKKQLRKSLTEVTEQGIKHVSHSR